MIQLRSSLIFALLLTSLWGTGCVRDRVTGESRFSLEDWTPAQEFEIGKSAAPDIESTFDAIYPDAGANEHLGKMVTEMISHSPRHDDFEWSFKILNSSQVNAFALPGGFVYITRGLLSRLEVEGEGEFVFALGHELGHVEHRHSMMNQSRSNVVGIFTAPITAVARVGQALPGVARSAVTLASGVALAPSTLALLSYSRSQESEADERGVFFAAETGFDPADGVKLFELFLRLESEGGGGGQVSWFRSHPLNEDRIKRVNALIAQRYPQATSAHRDVRKSSPEFRALVSRFRDQESAYHLYDEAVAVVRNPDSTPSQIADAEKKLTEASKTLTDQPLVPIAQGEAAFVREDWKSARSAFQNAVEQYERRTPGDGHWKPHFYLGLLDLHDKKAKRAVQHLEQAKHFFPGQPAVYLFLGEAYEEAGNKEQARSAYVEVLKRVPRDHPLYEEASKRTQEL